MIKKKLRKGRVKGTADRPRLSVFRSNKLISAQIIDDAQGKTLVAVNEKELESTKRQAKTARAKQLGLSLAKKALAKKIKSIVFDRGRYHYQGRVRALAEGAREGGLKF